MNYDRIVVCFIEKSPHRDSSVSFIDIFTFLESCAKQSAPENGWDFSNKILYIFVEYVKFRTSYFIVQKQTNGRRVTDISKVVWIKRA